MHMVSDAMYESAFKETRDVVRMAQAGKYKEGYLCYVIRCLEILKEAGKRLHRPEGELHTLNRLISEFKHELMKPDENFHMSPLEELFEEHHAGTKSEHDDHMNGNGGEKAHPDPKMLGRNPH